MTTQKHAFSCICEPRCPLLADIYDEGNIVRLNPDLNHPSGGTVCHKGLSYLQVHNDPDRVSWPPGRMNPRLQAKGVFV